ncbi:MAG: hypothetical protein GXP31_03420 [Kiritimatiellaeota bacterium]|nr:hypothetical protein [Kiritimatiellota bacterium]
MKREDTDRTSLTNHFVICNWNDLGDEIVRQLHAPVVGDCRPIVIVTDRPEAVPQLEPEGDDDPYRNVFVIPGDPASDRILARAAIDRADTAIVLADMREPEHADTRSVLIALAIEAIEPRVHTIVELLKSRNRIHFQHTSVDEVVCIDELTEKLIAQAALTHGLSEVYIRLLTATEDTNEIYVVPVPSAYVGKPYRALEKALVDYEEEAVILVGVQTFEVRTEHGAPVHDWRGEPVIEPRLTINPPPVSSLPSGSVLKDRDYLLKAEDRLFVIAYRPPSLRALSAPESQPP